MIDYYIGIDPGLSGGVVVLNSTGGIVDMLQMPTKEHYKKRTIDGNKLGLFLPLPFKSNTKIGVESVHSMPKQSMPSMFSFGMGFGKILGVLEAMYLPYTLITPQTWKKYFKVSKDKHDSILVIENLYTDTDKFFTKRGRLLDGLVDATLIARYMYEIQTKQ